MQWLQGAFPNRFKRFRNYRGHGFQGRYKALHDLPDSLSGMCGYAQLQEEGNLEARAKRCCQR